MAAIPEIAPISDLRHRQNELLAMASAGPIILTQRGRAISVLIGPERWNALMETLEDLQDAVDAMEARLAAEPVMDFHDYLLKRGEGVPAATE